jgi:Na+-transporting NADH:ubiquinone oxidoreductase subunit E
VLHLILLFLAAIFTHNIALTYILGMCPFLSLSRNINVATGMAAAVTFVVTLTAAINWPIYHLVLVPTHSELIYYIVFIIVIAASVQLLEMVMERFFPSLQSSFGIFLPLITVNCIVLAVSLFMILRNYTFLQTIFFSVGSSLGWMLAIVMVAAINEKLELIGDIPKGYKGTAIVMVIAGIIALSFIGFGGMLKIQ